jgi:hypothetical protein
MHAHMNRLKKISVADPTLFDAVPDLDPAFHLEADPDLTFHLMRTRIWIRIQLLVKTMPIFKSSATDLQTIHYSSSIVSFHSSRL